MSSRGHTEGDPRQEGGLHSSSGGDVTEGGSESSPEAEVQLGISASHKYVLRPKSALS